MPVITQYTSGRYRANERSLLARSSNSSNGSPLILCFHGRGGDATQFSPMYYNGLWPFMESLASAGYIVVSVDAGASLSNWGNADAMTAVNAAYDWCRLTGTGIDLPRAGASLGLMGWSMGGLVALNAHTRLQATYGANVLKGTFLFAPVVNLDNMHANANYTAEINSAYGGTYDQGDVAYNPAENLSSYAGKPPIQILHSSDDPSAPYQDSVSFTNSVAEATLLPRTGRGHYPFVGESPETVTSFFQGVMPT